MRPEFKEHMAVVDKYLGRLQSKDGNNYLVTSGDEHIPLNALYTLFNDVLLEPTHFSTSRVFEKFLYHFCDIVEEGVVSGFNIELNGSSVSYRIRYHKGVSYNGGLVLPNKASRYYLCTLLSGINANLKVHRFRDLDFILSYDGERLSLNDIRKQGAES